MKVGRGEFLETLDFLMFETKYNLNCFMSFCFSQLSLQNLMEYCIIRLLHVILMCLLNLDLSRTFTT